MTAAEISHTTESPRWKHEKTVFALVCICAALLLFILGMLVYLYVPASRQEAWQEQYSAGSRYLSDGDYQEAVLAFSAAIGISPKRSEAYIGRGDAYAELGNYDAARQDYRQAMEMEPSRQESLTPKLEQLPEQPDSPEAPPAQLPTDEATPGEKTAPGEETAPDEEAAPGETVLGEAAQASKKCLVHIWSHERGYPAEKAVYQFNGDGRLSGVRMNLDDGSGHEFQFEEALEYDSAGRLNRLEFDGLTHGYNDYFYENGVLSGFTQTITGGDGVDPREPAVTEYRIERNAEDNSVTRSCGNEYYSEANTFYYDANGVCSFEKALAGSSEYQSFNQYTYDTSYGGVLLRFGSVTMDLNVPIDPIYDAAPWLSFDAECTLETDGDGFLSTVWDSSGRPLYTFDYEFISGTDLPQALSFKSLPSDYTFSSGAGAWRTTLTIYPDGSFEGHFSDSDMGAIGADYPRGTIHYCDFTGTFTQPQLVAPYTYEMRLTDFLTNQSEGFEYIEDGTLYVSGDPYGFDGGDTYYLYLPGCPTADLPEDVALWVRRSYGVMTDTIANHLICGAENQHPFISNVQ